jgi:tetratricopeptide (TPR) repeat protein
VHRDLVDLYLEMGRVKDAEREYLTAIEAGDAESYLNLGFLYEDLQRFDEAERHYRAAIHAGVARAHISLGNLLDKLGRPSDAEKEYRLAMFARADMPNAAYNLAVSLEKQGREEEAIEGYRTAAYLGFKPARWIIADRERRRSEGRDGMDVWIGLVDLKAAPGNYLFEGAAGAWTNACAPARDENEYRHAVEAAFRDMALEVVKIENIVRFRERVPGLDPNAEMFDIAARVARTSRVAYDYFHLHGLQEK